MTTTTADIGDHGDERGPSAVTASRAASSHFPQPGVLISSAGRRGALVQLFQTTLSSMFGGGMVVAADMSPLSAAGALADRFEIVPACDADEFIPHMIKLCTAHNIGLLIPTHDAELGVYARNRDAFAAIGTTVMISAPETITIGSDKLRTYRWLLDNGFPTVRTALLREVLGCPRDWRPPFIVKPTRGYASSGLHLVGSWDELRGLGAGLDAPAAAVGARRVGAVADELLVQQLAGGVEHTVDVWVDQHGRCRVAVPRRRIEVRAGEVQKSMTVRHPALQALAHDIVERLPGARGALNVQVFVDGADLAVIEINTRFGGGYPLTWQAGADFPRWTLEELYGPGPGDNPVDPAAVKTTAAAEVVEWRDGLVMLRYDSAVFVPSADLGLGS
jgi:carbamoyl-phosphate synthase large subunit